MSLIGLLSGACLLAGVGLGIWEVDTRKRRRQAMKQHVQTLLELREERAGELIASAQAYASEMAAGLHFGPPWLRHAATWRAVCSTVTIATMLALPLVVLGWLAWGLTIWVGLIAVGTFWAWQCWQQLCRQLRLQLPAFIDNMVRMVMLGHAVQSAFLFSAAATKMPLYATVNQAAAFARAGMPVDQALTSASRHWDMEEFLLLSAIMQVGGRFGGRIDSLLERVASFIRDRQQAKQELHALSAEVRLSAWVLGLLPIVIGGLVIVTNASYFLQMWADATGRQVLFIALGLQACGALLLYRLAQLD